MQGRLLKHNCSQRLECHSGSRCIDRIEATCCGPLHTFNLIDE